MPSKERILFLTGLVILALVALSTRRGAQQADEWNPLVFARSKHTGCAQARPRFVEDDLSAYVSSRTPSPFTLPSEKIDLPPQDIDLPPVGVGVPALPVPSPFPLSGRALEWVFIVGATGPLAIKPTDLPAEADLDALIASATAGDSAAESNQQSELQPCDVVHLKAGGEKIEGKVESQTKDGVWIKRKKDGIRAYYDAKDILRVERATTPGQEYRERAGKVPADNAAAHVELSKWCEKNGLLAEAAIELEKAMSLTPRDILLALQLGDLYRRMVDLDREMDVYKRAVQNAPINVERVYVKLGEVYELLGLFDKAQNAYTAAIDALPTFSPARIALAGAIVKAGKEDDYSKAHEQLERVAQEDSAAAGASSFLLAGGLLHLAAGDVAEAKEALHAAAAKENTFTASNALASCAIVEGDIASASKRLVDAIKANPFAPAPWNSLGFLCLVAGQYGPAGKAFACALQQCPVSAEARVGQALCEFAGQKLDDALKAAEEAAAMNPRSLSAQLLLGRLLLDKGALDDSEEHLRAALAIDPNFSETALALGLLAMAKRNFQEAVAYLERVSPKYPKRLECKSALGVAYLGMNQLDKAEREFREILKTDDKNLPALCGLAYLSYVNKRATEATKRFNEVIRVDQTNAYAAASLKTIGESVTRTLWEDTFLRSDREDVGKGWEENEGRFGISIQLEKKKALFVGTQAVKDWGVTSLERTVREASFLSAEADMDISRSANACVGVCILTQFQGGKQRGGLLFGLDEEKQPVFTVIASLDDALDWKKAGSAGSVSTDTISLGIDRAPREPGSKKAAELRLLLNGQEIGRLAESKVTSAEQLIVGVFGMSRKDEKWELEVTRVRIIEKKQ